MSLKRKEKQHSTELQDDEYSKVIEGIKQIYKQKIKPVEVTYNFEGTVLLTMGYNLVSYCRVSFCPFN